MASEFKMHRVVEFVETDMDGIMHFSNYFRYMEMTETAFLRTLGCSVCHPKPFPTTGLPRVHAECDYQAPLRFEDEVEIHLRVAAKTEKSLTYDFVFNKLNPPAMPAVATGRLVTVYVVFDPGQNRLVSAPIPADIARKIEVSETA